MKTGEVSVGGQAGDGAHYDVVLIGAGIVGLATARELVRRSPGLKLAVVDKEKQVGAHQSGHNSGVLHAGVYYKPGSLKAQLCVAGKTLMEQFAIENDIPFEKCGKLIVALDESELARLDDLQERGTANGVPGLRRIGPEELREIEPHSAGIQALHSPGTGIIDFARVTRAFAELLMAEGVDILLDHEVVGISKRANTTVVTTSQGELTCGVVISCAGLHSDRVAAMNSAPPVKIVPFRGDYYTLKPEARGLCRGLIYPVPDPTLPFLGVHFTKRIDGEVWAGPNAVLAAAREGYRRRDFSLSDLRETLTFPGFRRLAASYWKTGAHEMWRDVVKSAFVRELQRYVPEVKSSDLVFGPSGVRAQALDGNGSMVDDFTINATADSMHVLNAPSPAATASLAIAGRIADKAFEHLDLPLERQAG